MQTKTQEEGDRISLRAIEDRAQRRDRSILEATSSRDQDLVKADVSDFEKIRDPVWREGRRRPDGGQRPSVAGLPASASS
jgi:hypothetical protein